MKQSFILAIILCCCGVYGQDEFPRVNAVVKAVRKSGKAVVNISTQKVEQRVDPFDEFRRRFFQDPFDDFNRGYRTQTYTIQSVGSGVIIDKSGYIVTNEHVIHNASVIMVSISGESKQFKGTLISAVPEKDLALVKIEPETELSAIEMGDSDTLMIGETAIALGNPFGLENTVTTGVISAANRSVFSEGNVVFGSVIQTDAAINPGNSGGALLNINGKLIGINTAIKQQAEGIGFAIPVNDVKSALKELLSLESIKGLWLGITVEQKGDKTVAVSDIEEGSPAEKAGIQKGDLITKIGAVPVENCLAFYKEVINASVEGGSISLEVNKEGKSVFLEKYGETIIALRCGLRGINLTRWIAKRLRINAVESGVLVSEVFPDSPAQEIGVEVRDVIVKLGENRIFQLKDLIAGLKNVQKGDKVPVVIVREGKVLKGEFTAR